MEAETLERNGPSLGLLDQLVPYYVVLRGAALGIHGNVISAEFEIAC